MRIYIGNTQVISKPHSLKKKGKQNYCSNGKSISVEARSQLTFLALGSVLPICKNTARHIRSHIVVEVNASCVAPLIRRTSWLCRLKTKRHFLGGGGGLLTSPEANRWLRLVQSVVTFDYRILDVNFEKKLLYNGTIPVVVAVRLLLMLLYEINMCIFQLLAFQLHGM